MSYTAIAAMDKNGVIGVDNTIPWRCRDDLKLFKKFTMNKAIVMGRKTYESVGLLSGRETIVLSRTMPTNEFVTVIRSLDELSNVTSKEIVIAGGEEVYKLAIKAGIIDRVIISHIDTNIDTKKATKVASFPPKLLCNFIPCNILSIQNKDAHNEFNFLTIEYIRENHAN